MNYFDVCYISIYESWWVGETVNLCDVTEHEFGFLSILDVTRLNLNLSLILYRSRTIRNLVEWMWIHMYIYTDVWYTERVTERYTSVNIATGAYRCVSPDEMCILPCNTATQRPARGTHAHNATSYGTAVQHSCVHMCGGGNCSHVTCAFHDDEMDMRWASRITDCNQNADWAIGVVYVPTYVRSYL